MTEAAKQMVAVPTELLKRLDAMAAKWTANLPVPVKMTRPKVIAAILDKALKDEGC